MEKLSDALHVAENLLNRAKDFTTSSFSSEKAEYQIKVDRFEISGPPIARVYVAIALKGTTLRFPSPILNDSLPVVESLPLSFVTSLHAGSTDTICFELWQAGAKAFDSDILVAKACLPIVEIGDGFTDKILEIHSGPDITAVVVAGAPIVSNAPPGFSGKFIVSASTVQARQQTPEQITGLRVRAPTVLSPTSASASVVSGDVNNAPRASGV